MTCYNTGKVKIGSAYQPRPMQMTSEERLLQHALLHKRDRERERERDDTRMRRWSMLLGACTALWLVFLLVGCDKPTPKADQPLCGSCRVKVPT